MVNDSRENMIDDSSKYCIVNNSREDSMVDESSKYNRVDGS